MKDVLLIIFSIILVLSGMVIILSAADKQHDGSFAISGALLIYTAVYTHKNSNSNKIN
jgi:hypothetical protein